MREVIFIQIMATKPAFRSARKTSFPSFHRGRIELVCDNQADACFTSTKPRQGMPWLRGEATGLPGP